MARKIPGSTQQKQPQASPQPQKTNKKQEKQKPEKKGGFFSNFGRNKQIQKSRENIKVAEDLDVENVQQVEDEEDLIPSINNRNQQQQSQPQVQPQPQVQSQIQQPQQQTPHVPYSKTEELYNTKQMEQSVFLYAKSTHFPTIQKHYNTEFTGILTLGTSSLDRLKEQYAKTPITKFIMLFVLEQSEVQYIKDFLSSLCLEQIQPNVLSILLIVDSNISVENLLTGDAQRKFIKVKSLNQKNTPFTKGLLNQLMSVVVDSQPSYIPPETKTIVPKQVDSSSISKNATKLYSKDLSSLKSTVDKLKQSSYTDDKRKAIMSSILTNTDLSKTLDHIEDIPHLKLIKAVEDEIEAEIQLIKDNPRMREQVEERISSKLILSTLRTTQMEEIISDIINTTVNKIDQVDSGLRDYNKNAVQELKQLGCDIETLAKKREEIKRDINTRFTQYKTLIQLVSNSANIQALAYKETNNDITQLMKENQQSVTNEVLTVVSNQVKALDGKKNSYLEQVKISNNRMIEALDLTNKIMESYKILVSLDDIVISSLLEENAALKQLQPVQVRVDSTFKSIGCNIVSLPGSGVHTILSTFVKPTDLVVYYGSRNLPTELSNIQQFTLENFLSTSWDKPEGLHMINLSIMKKVTNPMQAVRQSEFDIREENVVNRLIAKLDYVSNQYGNIYIIYEPTEDDTEFIGENLLFNKFTQHLQNIVIWTQLGGRRAIMTSHIARAIPKDLHSVKIFFNKVSKDYQTSLEEFLRISNIQATSIIIPYISDIEEQIQSNKPTIVNALKNIKHRMR